MVCDQRTVYGAEYQLQYVGNDGNSVEIFPSLCRVGPPVLKKEQEEHDMQVCEHLLNQYKVEGVSFLNCIITGDKMWYHHYEPESK